MSFELYVVQQIINAVALGSLYALVAIGLSLTAAEKLRESAARQGFVVDANDPRRHVIACAGTPACASARLPTRELAPQVAQAARLLGLNRPRLYRRMVQVGLETAADDAEEG